MFKELFDDYSIFEMLENEINRPSKLKKKES